MALSIVQAVAAYTTVQATSVSTAAITTTGGDALAVGASNYDPAAGALAISGTVGGSADGNTYSAADAQTQLGAGGDLLASFYAKNIKGGASHVFKVTSPHSSFPSIGVIEIGGADATAPLDAHPANAGDTSLTTSIASPSSGTLAQASEIVVALMTNDGSNNVTITVSSGWTRQVNQTDTSGMPLIMATQIVSATTAVTCTFTDATAAVTGQAGIFSLKAASGGGSTTADRDTPQRLRLLVVARRDAPTRLRLRADTVRDAAARVGLRANALRDAVWRWPLQAGARRDNAARVLLRDQAHRDTPARLPLSAPGAHDIPGRWRLLAPATRDAAARFQLLAAGQAARDASARLRLLATAARDVATRLPLTAAGRRDGAGRLRLLATAARDVAARARLAVPTGRDAATRLRPAAVAGRDGAARLRLLAWMLREVACRALLAVATARDVPARWRAASPESHATPARLVVQTTGAATAGRVLPSPATLAVLASPARSLVLAGDAIPRLLRSTPG